MKVTFERIHNGWLVTDATEDEWGTSPFRSVFEDNEDMSPPPTNVERMFNDRNYMAESLCRALWAAFGEQYYQSKRQGGLDVTYYSQGREQEELEEDENIQASCLEGVQEMTQEEADFKLPDFLSQEEADFLERKIQDFYARR